MSAMKVTFKKYGQVVEYEFDKPNADRLVGYLEAMFIDLLDKSDTQIKEITWLDNGKGELGIEVKGDV